MKYILFVIIFCIGLSANAQPDSSAIATIDTTSATLKMENDTSKAKAAGFFSFLKEDGFSPKKAAFYSTVFPGGGQLYNRQYWKAPIALGAVGTAGYFVYDNTIQYRRFRDAYRLRVDGDPTTVDEFANIPGANEAALVEKRDSYRKFMEQSYIAVVVVYGLQVLEAYTAAHLKNFDIDEDLSLDWQPTINIPVGFQPSGESFFMENRWRASNMEVGVKMQLVRKQHYLIENF
ncbi:MAG: DUF5683 domain-containing protein [Saprospiraceae bacterium]